MRHDPRVPDAGGTFSGTPLKVASSPWQTVGRQYVPGAVRYNRGDCSIRSQSEARLERGQNSVFKENSCAY